MSVGLPKPSTLNRGGSVGVGLRGLGLWGVCLEERGSLASGLWGLGHLGCRVEGFFGFRVSGLGLRALGFGVEFFRVEGFRVE